MKIFKLSSLFCLLLSLASPAVMAKDSSESSFSAAKGDSAIILPKLHLLNQSEIRAGLLAERNACRAEVRGYGVELRNDHTTADAAVSRMLQQRGIRMVPLLEGWEMRQVQKQDAALRQLSFLRGCAFDRPFLSAMVDAHEFAIQVASSALASATDASVRSLLQDALPKLRMHLAMARQLLGH